MGCSTCEVLEGEKVNGCQNNGHCQSGGCSKLNVFDWLSEMQLPTNQIYSICEVRFKNGRKEFYRQPESGKFVTGDAVVVDVPNGHHLGHISLQGELVRLQMKKKGISEEDEIRKIYRLATGADIEKFRKVRNREVPTLYRTREIIQEFKLGMKLTDVEYQADNSKATFYYSADDRVDFRELIKVLAAEFKIRVEMKQISLRQEASRIGGIGSCGRELCCSTWLSNFKSVSTQAARYQNLSLNPSKLSGQCGRLKCCLNYELETYVNALNDIPEVEEPLITDKGEARLQKTDIFRKILWFSYDEESSWHPLPVDRVNEIIKLNKEGKKPANLNEDAAGTEDTRTNSNHDLEALDRKFQKKRRKKKSSKSKKRNNNSKR